MQVIQWNPEADPWYQFGKAVGNGLGLLNDNREARGAAKQQHSDNVQFEREQNQNVINGLTGYAGVLQDPNATENDKWFAKWKAQSLMPNSVLSSNLDEVNKQIGLLQQKDTYLGDYANVNKGKRLHDTGYMNDRDYLAEWQPKGLMGGV